MESKSNSTNSSTVICTSKKHWIVYIFPYFMIVLGVIFVLSSLKYYMLAGSIILLISVMKILGYKSVKWILTDNELIIKSGFFPWNKSYFDIPLDTIFEAYLEHNLFADLFGYAHLNIRRTEGATSSFRTTKMTGHKQMTGSINVLIRELKRAEKQTPASFQPLPSNSADELLKLSQLKQQGILTDEEFERMKRKLIN